MEKSQESFEGRYTDFMEQLVKEARKKRSKESKVSMHHYCSQGMPSLSNLNTFIVKFIDYMHTKM